MKISERIEGTIENWRIKWGDTLKEWAASFLSWGIELIMDITGKGLAKQLDSIYDKVATEQNIPPEVIAKIKDTWKGEGQWQMMLGSAAGGTAVGSLIGSTLGPWLKLIEYMGLKIAKPFRFDPGTTITAWRRDPAKYEALFEDLREQGWDEDRIEALKFVTLFLPSAPDIVHWYAREVYEPEMIDRYGLGSELPEYEKTDFPKIGVDAKQAKNYWMAHWEHASYMQIREMLHRGVLSKAKEMPTPPTTKAGWATRDAEGIEAAYDWYRLVEIPPFWRARLTAMMWEVPTRVDVRRWWDMRTISEERLRSIYHSRGYQGEDLEDYLLWTKVYVAFPDLIARWKNGWISEDDVRNELLALKMPADRVEEMIQTKIKPTQPERVEGEKSLTKAEIYAGVKKGVIGWDEGLELLQDLGYGRDEAQFILEVRVGVEEGSPDTFSEFKKWTQDYRHAMGLEAKIPPQELLDAGKALRDAEIALKEQEEKGVKGEKLAPYTKAVSDATYRYRQLLAKWKAET